MVFSYLSLMNSIAAPVQFFVFEWTLLCYNSARRISWYIFFAFGKFILDAWSKFLFVFTCIAGWLVGRVLLVFILVRYNNCYG